MNSTIEQFYYNFYANIASGLSNRASSTQASTNTQTTNTQTQATNPILATGVQSLAGGLQSLATGAKATYYDPALGGINASGIKTKDGLPATATGEGYKPEVFSAAAFPPLLALLPPEYLTSAETMPGGKTLAKPINVRVKDSKTGKEAIIRVNDVGPGVAGHSKNHMLDFSVAAKNYFGEANIGNGLQISIAPENAQPGAMGTIA